MKQLNKIETFLFIFGGLMMVAGVGLYVFGVAVKAVSIAFLVGAVLFAVMQTKQTYQGQSTTIKRLKSIMTVADVAFVVAGLLMFENAWHLLYQSVVWRNPDVFDFQAHTNYMEYINNKWVVALIIAAMLEMYSINRISYELKKEESKTEKNIKD